MRGGLGDMRWVVTVAVLLTVACTGEVSGDTPLDARVGVLDAGPPALDAEPAIDARVAPDPAVELESPSDGATFVRDAILDEAWIARVEIVVRAEGVDHVQVEIDGAPLETLRAPAWSTFAHLAADGEHAIAAIGRDAEGVELARDETTITVAPPADTSCHAKLDALGIEWSPIASLRGVADPVRVQPFINGVRYRYVSHAEPQPMTMDCSLAPRLHRLSELVRGYGIDEVIHIGIYNYRCIGGGDPDTDDCTPSQHARAQAIDLHAFGLADSDEVYSTEDDFVITRRADDCPMMSSSEPDRVLKEIACALWSERIFQIVLTPNYNAAHRNHFHVDLTAGSMYLGAGVEGVDPAIDGLGH